MPLLGYIKAKLTHSTAGVLHQALARSQVVRLGLCLCELHPEALVAAALGYTGEASWLCQMRLCDDCVLAVSGSVTAAAPARREAVLRLPWQPAENRLRLEFLWLPESSPSSPLVRTLPTLGSTDCVNSKTTGVTNRVSNINVSWRNEEVK